MRRVDETYGEVSYGIVEVFYDIDDSDTGIGGWTVDYMEPHGETLEELRENLQWMLEALDKPVLDEAELDAEIATRPKKGK